MTTYRTKDGAEITFQVANISTANTESKSYLSVGLNTWVRYKISAHTAGYEVGYLKTAYIPMANWKLFFPTIWHYAFRKAGWGIDDEFLKSLSSNPLLWTPEQKARLIDRSRHYLHCFGFRCDPITAENLPELWEIVNRSIRQRMLKHYRGTKAHHVDKPLVDYIETQVHRQGIGIALYRHTAQWLHETFGFSLYASTLQSDEAKAVWAKMEDLGWVHCDNGRRRLSYDLIVSSSTHLSTGSAIRETCPDQSCW